MNDIRLNKEEEKEIIRARFKVPPLLIVLFVLFFILFDAPALILGIYGTINGYSEFVTIMVIGIVFSLVTFFLLVPPMIKIKKSQCIITNKRIYGVTTFYYAKKKYSYRLDEINNIETVSAMGVHGLALNFSQGNGPQPQVIYRPGIATVNASGTFRISNIKNIDEIYDKLSEMLISIKNDKDLMVDIEMSKIDAENRKAAAFENMASNMAGSQQQGPASKQNYIEELKGLKELLDSGIISEKEFEEKKKDLLKNS